MRVINISLNEYLCLINDQDNPKDNNPKIITKFEPLIWLAFIALTAVVGCPVF